MDIARVRHVVRLEKKACFVEKVIRNCRPIVGSLQSHHRTTIQPAARGVHHCRKRYQGLKWMTEGFWEGSASCGFALSLLPSVDLCFLPSPSLGWCCFLPPSLGRCGRCCPIRSSDQLCSNYLSNLMRCHWWKGEGTTGEFDFGQCGLCRSG